MASITRGLRVTLARDSIPLRPCASRLILPSTPRRHLLSIRPLSTSSFSYGHTAPQSRIQSRTLTTLVHTKPSSKTPFKAFSTTSPSRATTPSASPSATAPSQTPPPSAYIEEGPEILPPHQPRIIVGDPARGRWTLSGVHAYVMAFLLHFVLFAFLIIDFINDAYSYLGIVVSEQLGR